MPVQRDDGRKCRLGRMSGIAERQREVRIQPALDGARPVRVLDFQVAGELGEGVVRRVAGRVVVASWRDVRSLVRRQPRRPAERRGRDVDMGRVAGHQQAPDLRADPDLPRQEILLRPRCQAVAEQLRPRRLPAHRSRLSRDVGGADEQPADRDSAIGCHRAVVAVTCVTTPDELEVTALPAAHVDVVLELLAVRPLVDLQPADMALLAGRCQV